VLVTLIGLFTYWQTRPAQLADRFVAAIQSGRYAEADSMFLRPQQHQLAAWMKTSYRIDVTARREPASLLDWIKGVSRVTLVVEDRSGWDHTINGATIEVTRRGLQDAAWSVEAVQRGPGLLPQAMGAIRQ
jgi:hypothetical protein